jgi:hypothetical protein
MDNVLGMEDSFRKDVVSNAPAINPGFGIGLLMMSPNT